MGGDSRGGRVPTHLVCLLVHELARTPGEAVPGVAELDVRAEAHGQVELLVEKLLHFKQLGEEAIAAIGNQNSAKADRDFNPEKLKSEMVKWLVAEEGNGAAD